MQADGSVDFPGIYAPTDISYKKWNFSTFADDDGDGLPNDWEMQYYGGVTNANPDALSSNSVNTVMEAYIAGLDPTNSLSRFVIDDLQIDLQNTIYWSGVSGRIYTVYWTTNLMGGFQVLESDIPWTGSPFTDTQHQGEVSEFYKLDVQIAE